MKKNMKNHLKFVFLCVRCGSLLALASDKHSWRTSGKLRFLSVGGLIMSPSTE